MYQEEKNGKGFRYLKAGQASNYPVKIETANFRASTLCKQHSNIIYVVGFPLWVLETKEKLSRKTHAFLKMEQNVKFRYYEKATKLEKISHLFWKNSCFYSLASKQVGDFCQIFEAFLKYLLRYSHLFFYQIKSSKKVVKYKQNILEQIIRISRKTLFLISWM